LDVWEDSAGYGHTSADPVDAAAVLGDNGGSHTVYGTILQEAGTWNTDWYVFTTDDAVLAAENYSIDYNFRVTLLSSVTDLYTVRVYKAAVSAQECTSMATGYTEYNDCVLDQNEGTAGFHLGAGTNGCSTTATDLYNYCDDMSTY
jgi:hypothetical protein